MYNLTDTERELLAELWMRIDEKWLGPVYNVFCAEHPDDVGSIESLMIKRLIQNDATDGYTRLRFNGDAFFYLDDAVQEGAMEGGDKVIEALHRLFVKRKGGCFRLLEIADEAGLEPTLVRRHAALLLRLGASMGAVLDSKLDLNNNYIEPNASFLKIKSVRALRDGRRAEHVQAVRRLDGVMRAPSAPEVAMATNASSQEKLSQYVSAHDASSGVRGVSSVPARAGPVLPERYSVTEEIGSGSSGTVYKARDSQLDCVLAVKVLPAEDSSNKEALERFLREARALAQLNHPNVVRVYDVVVTKVPHPYIAMEYVEGRSLREYITSATLSAERLRILREVSSAMEAVHSKQIIHRDLSPNNILIAHNGTVKVIDFGWTKMPGTITVSNMGGVGTPGYISPEQQQSLKSVDHRTDIYSFGCLLYFVLVGTDPGPAARIPETYPQLLREIFEKCVSEKPEGRYGTMCDVNAALGAVLEKGGALAVSAAVVNSVSEAAATDRFRIAHAPGDILIFPAKLGNAECVVRISAEISTLDRKVTFKELALVIKVDGAAPVTVGLEWIAKRDSILARAFPSGLPWSLADNECKLVWLSGVVTRECAEQLKAVKSGILAQLIAKDHMGFKGVSNVEKKNVR